MWGMAKYEELGPRGGAYLCEAGEAEGSCSRLVRERLRQLHQRALAAGLQVYQQRGWKMPPQHKRHLLLKPLHQGFQ